MKGLFAVTVCASLAVWGVGCKKDKDKGEGEDTTATAPEPQEKPEEPEEQPEEPVAETPDTELDEPVGVNLADVEWSEGPGSLPKGSQISVLEGEPPFAEGKTFTFLLKLPKNYTVPPHTHLVTERVTVLQGEMSLGHGEKLDKKAAKKIKVGGTALLPAGHAHFAMTGNKEAVIQLQGVGPWGIFYIDPKDDPRETPPEKPEITSDYDSEVEAKIVNLGDEEWGPAPTELLPKGAQLAVLEGEPPFDKQKTYLFRIKVPNGYRFQPHTHGVTDRPTVLKGALPFGFGKEWSEEVTDMKAGAVGVLPAGNYHFAGTKGETVFQVFGVGPFDIQWADPNYNPAEDDGKGNMKGAGGAKGGDDAKGAKGGDGAKGAKGADEAGEGAE